MPFKVAKKPASTRTQPPRNSTTASPAAELAEPASKSKPKASKTSAAAALKKALAKDKASKMAKPTPPKPLKSPPKPVMPKPVIKTKATKTAAKAAPKATTKNTPKVIEKRGRGRPRKVVAEEDTVPIPAPKKTVAKPKPKPKPKPKAKPAPTPIYESEVTGSSSPSNSSSEEPEPEHHPHSAPPIPQLIPGQKSRLDHTNRIIEVFNKNQSRLIAHHAQLHAEGFPCDPSTTCPGLDPFVPKTADDIFGAADVAAWANEPWPVGGEEWFADAKEAVPRAVSVEETYARDLERRREGRRMAERGEVPVEVPVEDLLFYERREEEINREVEEYLLKNPDSPELPEDPGKDLGEKDYDVFMERALVASRFEECYEKIVTCEECQLFIEMGLNIPPVNPMMGRCTCWPPWDQANQARACIDEAVEKQKKTKGRQKLSTAEKRRNKDPKKFRLDFETRVQWAFNHFVNLDEDEIRDGRKHAEEVRSGSNTDLERSGATVVFEPKAGDSDYILNRSGTTVVLKPRAGASILRAGVGSQRRSRRNTSESLEG